MIYPRAEGPKEGRGALRLYFSNECGTLYLLALFNIMIVTTSDSGNAMTNDDDDD